MLSSGTPFMASYPPTAEVIADFLRLRQSRGQLVVAKLAQHLGIGGNALAPVVRGERPFPMKNLDATAEFFGVDAPDFIHLA